MDYIKEIVFVAVVCGFVSTLSMLGRQGNDRFVRFVCSLAFLSVLLSPLADNQDFTKTFDSFFNDISLFEYKTHDTADAIPGAEIISEEICAAALSKVEEEFGVPSSDFQMRISLEKDGELLLINKATVFVNGGANDLDKTVLKSYLSDILNCNVEVISSDKTSDAD